MKSVLLMGYGQLLQGVSPLLDQANLDWLGISRSQQHPRLLNFDLRQPWPQRIEASIALITISAYGRSEQEYRASYLACAQGIAQAIKQGRLQAKQLIWVSSTSVWGQTGLVNEEVEALPESTNSKILLQAEQCLQQAHQQVCIVRFAGLYGGSDWLIRRWQQGLLALDQHSHRMHREDASALLFWLSQQWLDGHDLPRLLIGYDGRATLGSELDQYFSQQLGSPQITNRPSGKASKIINSSKLQDLGFRCQYADFRSGYQGIIQQHKSND